jgi:hypothetical protein
MNNPYFKIFGSTLIVGIFLFLAFGSDDSKSNQEITSSVDCSGNKDAYAYGYKIGTMCKTMGDHSSCEGYVQKYNYSTGRDILVANDCFCDGFNDGKEGNPKKYSSGEDNSNSNSDNNYSSYDDNSSESSYSTYDENSESINSQEAEESQNSTDLAAEEELEEDNSSTTNSEEYNFNGFPLVKTPHKINPNPINGSQNVFFNKNYTLFDQSRTNEPIYPILKNGILVYQIYYSSNEDPRPYYGEFTPEQLEKHLFYKFKNKANCMIFCNSKK